MGKIAKFTFFTAGWQPTECAVQRGISDFLTADEKTYTGSSVQTVNVPIEFEFLGILMLLKWTSLYLTSSQLLLLLLHQTGLMILRVLCTDVNPDGNKYDNRYWSDTCWLY